MFIHPKIYKTAFWTAIVGLFILSSLPDISANKTFQTNEYTFRFDYLFHFLAYFVIGMLYVMAYKPNLTGILLITGYAALEEIHQYWIPGRTLNPVDLAFDLAGLAAVAVVWWIGLRKKRQE